MRALPRLIGFTVVPFQVLFFLGTNIKYVVFLMYIPLPGYRRVSYSKYLRKKILWGDGLVVKALAT